MGQSNIKYERVSPVISDDDSEDEIDVEIGNLKKSDEKFEITKPEEIKPDEIKPGEIKPDEIKPDEVKPDEIKPFSKAWCIGVGFATISGEAQFISKINIKYKNQFEFSQILEPIFFLKKN